jgi:type IV secretion system protein TrbF
MRESNPYLTESIGRKEWNDRYDNLTKSRKHWQLAFVGALLVVIIQSVFIGCLSLRTAIQPFVVETTQGMPYAIKPVNAVSMNDSRLVNYALNQFIMNVRTVLKDTEAEKNILINAYAFSAKQAKTFLHEYFLEHDPFKTAAQYTVSVQIVNSLPISKNTWQISWDESRRDSSGKLIDKTRWLAQLHYETGAINSRFVTENPFGIYITEMTWSENHVKE